MGNKKLFSYGILTSLGFIAAVLVGLFMFTQLRKNMFNYNTISQKTFQDQAIKLSVSILGSTARYIEEKYPVLHDTEKLKAEAGSDWFWDMSEELNHLADVYNIAYIYYIEKIGSNYRFLMSSEILRDEHPEWLGTDVWTGEIPSFFDEAWETGVMTISREITVNEWGTLITAAEPILSGGRVVGILGISYDIAFLDVYMQDELRLEDEEKALFERMRFLLIICTGLMIVFMGYQVWLSTNSVVVPLRQLEADERTRLMLDATPMLCTLCDTVGNIIDCNNEIMRVIGVSDKSEFLSDLYSITPETQPDGENSRTAIIRHINETLDSGFSRFEWTLRTTSGEIVPLETSMVRVPWQDSFRIAVYSSDQREARAKDAALLESEDRLRVMFDAMSFACFYLDSGANIIDCNKKAIELFGCRSREEFISKYDDLSPEYQPDGRRSREKKKEIIQNVFNIGRNIFTWEHLKLDGTPLPVEVTVMPVPWKNGFRVIAYIRDLSLLFKTEDNLKRIMAITESSPNFILSLGPNGIIEYMNPAIEQITGIPPEELQKKGLSLLFSSEDFETLNRDYISAVLENRPVAFQLPLVTRINGIRDFFFSAFPVQMRYGTAGIGFLGRDITEMNILQRELTSAKEQAERSLASEILYNKARSDFLSMVSHELRTPLNAIIGITGMAGKGSPGTDIIENYSGIKNASERLLSLVNDILDMAGLENGEFDFTFRPFNAGKAIEGIVQTVSKNTMAKNQSLKTDIKIGACENVIGDERRLRQILLNLLGNAVKFTPENGIIQFKAGISENTESGCRMQFEVIDNGIGMSAEVQDHLGEIFKQGDSGITRKHGGMGLGLPLTKRIVELMNGSIRAESQPGNGSHFYCDVWFDKSPNPQEGNGSEDAEAVPNAKPNAELNLDGKRLLIVDDVDINREILIGMLEDRGAILDEARDGSEAVQIFSGKKYDLILMDLHMPNMDGFTAARQIRSSSLPWAKTVPIISVSAEDTAESRQKCLEAGMSDNITKPIEADALFGILSKWTVSSAG